MISLERQDAALLILFLALIAYPLLYIGRGFDDNTLTRWGWVFASVSPAAVFLPLLPALAGALFLSRIEIDERREPVVLFLLSFLAALPAWGEPEVILDASRYFLQAKHLEQSGILSFFRDWGRTLFAWTDLPLLPFLYGLVFRVLGEHRVLIQLFTTGLFALSAVSSYWIGRRLWDRETGFLAGILLLAMPYLLTQVPLMLVDVPALFLVTLAVRAYLQALDRGGPGRVACAAGAVAAAALAKYSCWPMLLVLPLITFVALREGRPGALRRSVLVLAASAVLAGMVLLPYSDVVSGQLALLGTYQWPALGRWKESSLSSFLFQVHPFVSLFAVIGAARAVRSGDLRFLVAGWFALFLAGLQVERLRYILPLLPFLALMAAYGLRTLFADAGARRFAAYSAAAASLVLVYAAYVPFLERSTMANLRDAGAYLDTLPGDAAQVQVMPQGSSGGNTEAAVPILDLFTRKQLIYDQPPPARPGRQAIARSPLRFTWELRLPVRYAGPAGGAAMPLVVISSLPDSLPGAPGRSGPDRQGPHRVFASDTGTFRYRTAVTVIP